MATSNCELLKKHWMASDVRHIEGVGYVGVLQFIFTYGLTVGLELDSYEYRYCYETEKEALLALKYWDGKGDPLGNWIVKKPEGIRNPNYLSKR